MQRVTYYHLLFERHEIARSNGAWSESLHPGGWLIEQDESLRTEIAALFPEILCSETQALPAARRVLTAREASILRDLPERFAGTGFPANRLAMP
ncbi:Hint domain-containing protein [Albidovulum inexpectatum]|uniref:Hint domain-containing protein n=1 Tax=Albidovulum inexpectatum TaxID=196587 RepID=A0A2S5JLQ2_9RHOB|nr:Hint domain-containing protein [Albidovulum inexpectatum]